MDATAVQQLTEINLDKIMHYVMYFLLSLMLFTGFFKTYIKFTPYDEIALIKKGNVAVAWVLGGTLLGYAVNLAFAMFYSYGILQFAVFGIFSALMQLITSYALQVAFDSLQEEIRTNNNVAVGIMFGAIALCVGVLNGASAY